MPSTSRIPYVLAVVREAVKKQGSNPYRLSKATGLSVGSVQNLLSERVSPSLRNIELLMDALGLEVRVFKAGVPLSAPDEAPAKTKSKREKP